LEVLLAKGGGRGQWKKALPQRNELLEWLISTPGVVTDGTMLDDARKKLHEILVKSNSNSSVEWLFNQLIGTPRSTIVQMIESDELLAVVSQVTAGYLEQPALEKWWQEIEGRLERGGPNNPEGAEPDAA
jgi:hypothetical protein